MWVKLFSSKWPLHRSCMKQITVGVFSSAKKWTASAKQFSIASIAPSTGFALHIFFAIENKSNNGNWCDQAASTRYTNPWRRNCSQFGCLITEFLWLETVALQAGNPTSSDGYTEVHNDSHRTLFVACRMPGCGTPGVLTSQLHTHVCNLHKFCTVVLL